MFKPNYVIGLIVSGILILFSVFVYIKGHGSFLKTEENEIKTFDAGNTLRFPDESDYILGNQNAPFAMIYYIDYDCPYCKTSFDVAEKLHKQYPLIKIAFRHLPLVDLHPEAFEKAVLIECLAAEGHDFFALSRGMLQGQGRLITELEGTTLSVEKTKIDSCLLDVSARNKVLISQREAFTAGLYSTPSVLILKDNILLTRLNFASEKRIQEVLPKIFSTY